MALNNGKGILMELDCVCIKEQFNPMNMNSCPFTSEVFNNFIF